MYTYVQIYKHTLTLNLPLSLAPYLPTSLSLFHAHTHTHRQRMPAPGAKSRSYIPHCPFPPLCHLRSLSHRHKIKVTGANSAFGTGNRLRVM